MIQTRRTDEKFLALFSVSHPFSEHLTKREDDQLRDKYDHNAFFYQGQPSEQEVRRALAYQKARGDGFLKLEGYAPLEKDFGLEREETLTMVLPNKVDPSAWKSAPNVTVGPPDPVQLEQNELRYYGPLYGEDFTVRNLCRLRQKLTYHGAYLDGKLAGSCYTYSYGGFTCMDGLLVDSEFRCRWLRPCSRPWPCRQGGKGTPCTCTQTRRTRPKISTPGWALRRWTGSMSTSAPTFPA